MIINKKARYNQHMDPFVILRVVLDTSPVERRAGLASWRARSQPGCCRFSRDEPAMYVSQTRKRSPPVVWCFLYDNHIIIAYRVRFLHHVLQINILLLPSLRLDITVPPPIHTDIFYVAGVMGGGFICKIIQVGIWKVNLDLPYYRLNLFSFRPDQ